MRSIQSTSYIFARKLPPPRVTTPTDVGGQRDCLWLVLMLTAHEAADVLGVYRMEQIIHQPCRKGSRRALGGARDGTKYTIKNVWPLHTSKGRRRNSHQGTQQPPPPPDFLCFSPRRSLPQPRTEPAILVTDVHCALLLPFSSKLFSVFIGMMR